MKSIIIACVEVRSYICNLIAFILFPHWGKDPCYNVP